MLYVYNLLSKLNIDRELIPNVFGIFGIYGDNGGKQRVLWFDVLSIPIFLELVLSDGGTVFIVNFFLKTTFLSCNKFITTSKTKIMY